MSKQKQSKLDQFAERLDEWELKGLTLDQIAGGGRRDGRQPFARQQNIERGDEVAGRIRQRAVEIENENRCGRRLIHGPKG